jgi:hypothetical protein
MHLSRHFSIYMNGNCVKINDHAIVQCGLAWFLCGGGCGGVIVTDFYLKRICSSREGNY